MTGLVLGMQATVVTPPAAAALVPLIISSLASRPAHAYECVRQSDQELLRGRLHQNLVSSFGNILAQSFNFAILNEDIHYSI